MRRIIALIDRRRRCSFILWAALIPLAGASVEAATEPASLASKTNGIQGEVIILQKDDNLVERISSADLAQYIRRIDPICAAHFSQSPNPGGVVFAVRPRGKARFWIDRQPQRPESTADRTLLKHLEAVSVPTVSKDVVIVGIRYKGLNWKTNGDKEWWPTPREWLVLQERNGEPMTTEQIVDQLWPAEH